MAWANIKNPISKVETKSLAHLEQQVIKSMRAHCTESMWLGAYRTTRQWEDEIFEQLDCGSDSCPQSVVGESDVSDITREGSESDEDEEDDA